MTDRGPDDRVRARHPGAAPAPRGGKKGRGVLGTLVYWTLVLGVWGLIGLVAFLMVFIPGLPDTSGLYAVDRQPSVAYLDRNGGLIAVRGSQEAPPASCRTMCRRPSSPSKTRCSTATRASIRCGWLSR
jgi:penicillin-binding protein 1A